MTIKCDFYYDVGSPNAYFVHEVLPKIEDRHGIKFMLKPILLGGVFKDTNNTPPMVAFGAVKNKLINQSRAIERFTTKHDIPFKMNPHFPVITVALMRGAVFAEDKPYYLDYINTCYKTIWVDGLKMDDPAVIAQALDEHGLPVQEILSGAQLQSTKDILRDKTTAAVARGIYGAPSMFVGDELFFGKDHLGPMEDEIIKAKAS